VWTKIKNFVKKYWALLVSAIAFIGGFLVGKRLRGTHPDFDELRANLRELRAENEQLIEQVNRLRAESKQASDTLEELRGELEYDSTKLADARGELEQISGEADRLRATNQRLRDFLSKYGEGLKDIEAN
jgi:uncharacterized protein (DUF3084 family)